MAVKRAKPNPDGIITARLTGASARHVSQKQVDAAAAVAELREIAGGRTDLLARQAGLIFGSRDRDVRDGERDLEVLELDLRKVAGPGDLIDVGAGLLRRVFHISPSGHGDLGESPDVEICFAGDRKHAGTSLEHLILFGGPGFDVLIPRDDREAGLGDGRDPDLVRGFGLLDNAGVDCPFLLMALALIATVGDVWSCSDEYVSEP
jgi:hypothetical protein